MEKNSVFKEVVATFFVDLPFYDMEMLTKAAKHQIASRVLKYDPDLKGVILTFSHVSALPKNKNIKMCRCYADSPFVHIKVQAKFLVFCPYQSCQLPAAVTFVSSSAISLTVFDYFQGYVDLKQHRENWSFRSDKWVRNDNNLESFAQNDYVVVEVIDVSPNNDGFVFNVQIIRKSDIPPIEQIEPDATENFQEDNYQDGENVE